MQLRKIISSSLSPNTQADDVREAIRVLFNPVSWQRGSAIARVENWFMQYLGASIAVSFDSGRSALLAILQTFTIGHGDEVLLQAFTCVAVPNSVRWAGATPVYVDIDESFNIDLHDLKKKITKQSRAIIIQHTFGIPAQMDAMLQFANVNNLLVIEDCAHSLGATYHDRKIGTLGDAAFFSFGRDKVLSSVWGGMATINAKCQMPNAKRKLKEIQNRLLYPSRVWIVQQLFHPIVFSLILPLYNVVIGKIILEFLKRLGLLSKPVSEQEQRGEKPLVMPRRFPNALAKLLVRQLPKLKRYNDTRRSSALYYRKALQSRSDITLPKLDTEGVYLRFPILVGDQTEVIKRAKRHGILLGNWYKNVIDPSMVDRETLGYVSGTCPKAETCAQHIVNLPTLISKDEALRVVAVV